MPLGLWDHLDVRVRDLARARGFYDAFCAAVGLGAVSTSECWVSYDSPSEAGPFLAITAEPDMAPSHTRIAFRAGSREAVDAVAEAAKRAGATEYEAPHDCPEYSEGYYAAFFADLDGNRYEVCHRPGKPLVARLWRGRVKPGLLAAYRGYVAETGLDDYRRTPGNLGWVLLTGDRGDYGEIVTLSLWDTVQSITRFAGDPPEAARYYPQDRDFLVDAPPNVEIFEARSS